MSRLLNRIVGKIVHIQSHFLKLFASPKGYVWMIHHVNNDCPDDEFTISPHNLERILLKHKKQAIPVSDIYDATKFTVFTVDDVSEDFYNNGFPLFLKHNIPFTIFVCIELLNKNGYISTDQLIEMSRSPLCTIGSHGTRHVYYGSLSEDEKIDFLQHSKSTLEKICGVAVETFAFPYGSVYACGLKHLKKVRNFYKYGFSTISAPITAKDLKKSYFIPRINLNNKTSA